MLKILFLYDCVYPDAQGGVEHRNDCLARRLADRGHNVTIAGWFQAPPAPHPRLTFLKLPFGTRLHDHQGKRGLGASLRFALACLFLPIKTYDIVETANIPYLHLFPLFLKTKRARKPLVVTWYEYFGPLWQTYKSPRLAPFFAFVETLAAKIGDEVCAISTLTQNRLLSSRNQNGRNQKRIHLMPCGVDLDKIKQADLSPETTAPPFLFAGRLIPEKRVDLLLHALALLPPTIQGPLLSIIGDGPDRPHLEQLVTELKLSERVLFLGKLATISDVWSQLAQARIAVQPSAREGFGLFPLEAMALGKPVIYCESPDNAIGSIVRKDIEGLCTQATPEQLAFALEKLLTDKTLWDQLHTKALARAQLFDWGLLAKEMEDLFYKVHKSSASPIMPPSSPDRDLS